MGSSAEDFSHQTLREEHLAMSRAFLERAADLGYGDLGDHFWYHTIDLGDGLITPGTYDYRHNVADFHFPESMNGMHVVDVGSATGFFAFEFERRGAEVVSVDLPSITSMDRFPGETLEQTIRKLEKMMPEHSLYTPTQRDDLFRTSALEKIHRTHLHGPFDFCHQRLRSHVKRCYSPIYELSREKLGRDDFELAFIGDVLLHTINPLQALAAVASVCGGTLIVAQVLPGIPESPPMMQYVGGEKPGDDEVSWWWPNQACFEQILRKLGFKDVGLAGYHTGQVRPGGNSFKRAVIHARR